MALGPGEGGICFQDVCWARVRAFSVGGGVVYVFSVTLIFHLKSKVFIYMYEHMCMALYLLSLCTVHQTQA